ncbi:hypothetical protein ABZP36_012656 [Zizania latifolia]
MNQGTVPPCPTREPARNGHNESAIPVEGQQPKTNKKMEENETTKRLTSRAFGGGAAGAHRRSPLDPGVHGSEFGWG